MDPQAAKQRLRGSIAPLITPFHEDGSLDLDSLRGLIDWQISQGSHGLSVTGTTGEPSSMSLDEREQVMEAAAEHIAGRVPFVPGTGTNNLDETMRLTRRAVELGADGVLVIVPYYNKPTQEGLYRYYRHIADSFDVPVIVYNIPGRTAVNLEPGTLARLAADCPNIIGVKESNVDFLHVNKVLALCGPDFNLYSGIEALCYPMLAIGGAGHISATANVAPKEVADLYNLWTAGKVEEARALHFRMLELNDVLFLETNPQPLKAALGMLDRVRPVLRPPLAIPGPEVLAKVRQALERYGYEIVKEVSP